MPAFQNLHYFFVDFRKVGILFKSYIVKLETIFYFTPESSLGCFSFSLAISSRLKLSTKNFNIFFLLSIVKFL